MPAFGVAVEVIAGSVVAHGGSGSVGSGSSAVAVKSRDGA